MVDFSAEPAGSRTLNLPLWREEQVQIAIWQKKQKTNLLKHVESLASDCASQQQQQKKQHFSPKQKQK